MICAAVLVAIPVLSALGDCPGDAVTLASEADALVAQAGSRPDAPTLDRARRLYRRARALLPSAAFSLRAADLACAAGDEEECGDLLSEVAETDGALLSSADRLLLALRAESRRAWTEAISHYENLRAHAQDAGLRSWAEQRIRRIEVEAEAQNIAAPAAAPPMPEARLALAEARRALSAGDLPKARERLVVARKLSPDWAEAALVLAALETREGRVPEAIGAYREVLATDPGRSEALVGLANLLWDEPDRSAKEEALAVTDRAVALRPDALSLLKTSAIRWAEWGDAPKALTRLDAYRRRATAEEKRATEVLREALARRVDALLSGRAPAEEPETAQLSSPAVDEWKVAQAYLRRGDPASLAAALDHLREAERLDPTFAPAAELAGAIHERRGDFSLAQTAYERAVSADPSRAATYERLATLLARQPGKEAEAEEAWRRAEQAGSSEALYHLAESASRNGRRGEALALYRRYLAESPGGVHTEEVSHAVARLESRRRAILWAIAAGLFLLVTIGGALSYHRYGGRTFEEWIHARPARAREARPVVGRLRHEVVKHGGLLFTDSAKRLADPDARAGIAKLLHGRLFGGAGSRGLLREAADAFGRLEALARDDGFRLNLRRKDPLFSPIARASRILAGLERPLARFAREAAGDVRPVVAGLEKAAGLFRSANGAAMSRVLERESATRVRLADLREMLAIVGAEKGFESPVDLEAFGAFGGNGPASVAVRVDPADWETIWRNLFENALEAVGNVPPVEVRFGVSAEILRDPVTGTPTARFVLADNLPGALSVETIRDRAADRGWGVIGDLVRRHDGIVEVAPLPAAGYRKGIVVELPALEPDAAS